MTPIVFVALGMALAFGLVWLAAHWLSFRAQRPEDYTACSEPFDLRRHLNGPIACEGLIYGPTGRVVSRFTGRFDARWNGREGVMREHFRFDSGNVQDREWQLRLDEDGRIEARAADVDGVGRGRQMGGAARLRYRIRLAKEAGGHRLWVTDWMYLTPGGAIVNRSQFFKFGFKVAELVATMRPDPEAARKAA